MSPGLRSVLAASKPRDTLTVLVDLIAQVDFNQIAVCWNSNPPLRRARGSRVRDALAAVAKRSDRAWLPLLKKLKKRKLVERWSRVTIINRFLVTGTPAMVRVLAHRNDVATISEQERGEGMLEAQSAAEAGESSWSLRAMQVQPLHDQGLDGRGVVIGLIDSGASDQHEQLAANFRGGERSWFDPLNGSPRPTDTQLGHGTSVLSCAVGQKLGVAPSAKWIAAVGLERHLYNNVILTRAADWMLNVGRPDVLLIPWRLPQPGCDRSLVRIVNAWRAAGIVVVFAAGNSGPDPSSDVSPANYTDLFPGDAIALSVGAVAENHEIYERSSRGPNHCGSQLFPQIVAPGVELPVAFPGTPSMYRTVSGTSFATGVAGGAAALLVQAYPDAQVEEIEEALRQGAVDLGAAGPDATYGFGMIDLGRSLEWLRSRHNSEKITAPRPISSFGRP